MVHHKIAFAPKLVPDSEGRPDGTSRITRRRLYIYASKRRLSTHLAIGNGVHCAAAGERQIRESGTLLQLPQKVKESFFIHRLCRARYVAVAVIQGVGRSTARTQ